MYNRLLGTTFAICLLLVSLLFWKQKQKKFHFCSFYVTLPFQCADSLETPRALNSCSPQGLLRPVMGKRALP
jgi:hypothetical protein